MKAIVIGCGKSKREDEAPARELYTGSLFRACRRYAEESGHPWAILSAGFGLVMPHWELWPYDVTLPKCGPELETWAMGAAGTLQLLIEPSEVVCLAGATYADPFARALECLAIPCSQPLAGMGIGARLSWLKANTKGAAA